jgi:hypothetical protein
MPTQSGHFAGASPSEQRLTGTAGPRRAGCDRFRIELLPDHGFDASGMMTTGRSQVIEAGSDASGIDVQPPTFLCKPEVSIGSRMAREQVQIDQVAVLEQHQGPIAAARRAAAVVRRAG